MSKKMVPGICHLCGQHRPLSYEHVPPEAAFNNRKVLLASADEFWNRGVSQGLKVRGEHLQRGFGAHTLCERCNNTTGSWYGPHFVEWCRQGMEFWDKTKGKSALIVFQTIYPLPIIKQVATMFMSLNASGFQARHPKLVRFIQDRERYYLDPLYRFWVYYVAPGPLRATPPCSVLNIETGQHTTGSEFSFPPFGYMMTLGSRPEDRRLFEITHFARYPLGAMERIQLNLATLPTHTPVLGDYRTFKRLDRKDGETNTFLNMN